MAVNRSYLADSGLIALSGTSQIFAMSFQPTSTNDANVAKVKFFVTANSGAAPQANASVDAQMFKCTGTLSGGATVTCGQLGGNVLAANTVIKSGSTTITGLSTAGGALWIGTDPETAGSSWADDHENTGLEIGLLPSATYALVFSTAAGAGSSLSVRFGVWFFE